MGSEMCIRDRIKPASTAIPEFITAISESSKLLAVWAADNSIISNFFGFSFISAGVIASPSLPFTLIKPADWRRNRALAPFDGSSGIVTLAPSLRSFISLIFDE